MAIIKCPECGHQISEKATVCPSCGVEIAGKITKCLGCGEVFFIDMGLCPHCYRPYAGPKKTETEEQKEEQVEEAIGQKSIMTETPRDDEKNDTLLEEDRETQKETEAFDPETTSADESETEEDKPAQETAEENVHADDNNDEEAEDQYIDTDGEQLEKPVHEADEEERVATSKKNYIPVVVSLAITALIAAVCFYFYQDTKMSRETEAFDLAMKSQDVHQLNSFLRNFTDASAEHKAAINEKIASITKEEEALSLSLVTRDKSKLKRYLVDYPDSPQKQKILSMIDSIDWEEALKTNTKAAYDQYIAEHATGLFIKEAKDKVTVKVLVASAEDEAMAKSLFREFFLSVNGNDASRLAPTLGPEISSFMGTEKASNGQVIDWMKRQHGDDVSSVIWKLNHDYKITKREQGGSKNYDIVFTAKQTIVHKDGRATSENFRITSGVTGNNKISSMNMSKYVPQSSPAPSSSTNTTQAKPATASSKPSSSASSSGQSKAKTTQSSSPKPKDNNVKSASSNSQSKPKSSTTQSKPASKTQASAKKDTPKQDKNSSQSGNTKK